MTTLRSVGSGQLGMGNEFATKTKNSNSPFHKDYNYYG
jgi:hypothetical protein